MARCGNHGIIIPRDKEMLSRMYWDENMTLPEMGAIFGVNHKSVLYAMEELGIERRRMGPRERKNCVGCGEPIFKVRHAGNGAMYGTRCKECRRKHYNKLARDDKANNPKTKQRAKESLRRWYYEGPINPQGESQWISKSRAMLRTAKRYLSKPASRAASQSRRKASAPAQTSQA